MVNFTAAGSGCLMVPGRRFMSRGAVLGKCMRAGETTSDCFLGTFHLARPELSKGGQMFKPMKMTFFSRVRLCYVTLSWNASSERQTPTEPRFSPGTALSPRTHGPCRPCSVLPASWHHSTRVSPLLWKPLLERQSGRLL